MRQRGERLRATLAHRHDNLPGTVGARDPRAWAAIVTGVESPPPSPFAVLPEAQDVTLRVRSGVRIDRSVWPPAC
jgi:hypothetical protein